MPSHRPSWPPKPKKESVDADVSWKLGAGGFISTIEDLTLFATLAPLLRRDPAVATP
jgi:hypothetical protein